MRVYSQSNRVSQVSDGGVVGTIVERFTRSHNGKSIGRVFVSLVSPDGAVMEERVAMMGIL